MNLDVFIDGFNVYHALTSKLVNSNQKNYAIYRWIDYYKLGQYYAIRQGCKLNNVFIFTTYPEWDLSKLSRHQKLVSIWGDSGCKIIFGKFLPAKRECNNFKNSSRCDTTRCSLSGGSYCNGLYDTREEKMSDVNLSIYLLEMAIHNDYEKAIIVSADTDIKPAVLSVKRNFPFKKIGVSLPIGRHNNVLVNACDFVEEMKKSVLDSCLLPDQYILKDSTVLNNPYK